LSRTILGLIWLAGASLARYDALSVSGEWMIGAYKAVLSPLQGSNVCNFQPTCSQFARGAIQTQGFLPGLLIGADRLMRCNTIAWSYYENYYAGEVIGGRMPDPVASHVAWLRPPDEPGLLISARVGNRSPERLRVTQSGSVPDSARSIAYVSPFSLGFADYLFSSGEYSQAAGEYLRVRFMSSQPGLSCYAGLMAGESYLRAGDLAQARHAFGDLSAPTIRDLRQYGIARTDFAAGDYVGTRTALGSITSPLLARQAMALDGWTFFRQRRFAEGASRISAIGSDGPSQRLSTMDGRDIRRRSRLASTLLSALVPGAGQIYSGRAGDGAYSFLTVAGTGLVTWWFAAEPAIRDRTRVKVSIFGVITALFYAGNVYGANIAARDYNLLQERRYVQRADSLFELMSLEPDYQSLLDSVSADTSPPGSE
jgi:putative component of membrane protein insertase Oxa1/YidC/SpoIIIJ protein YidD/TM2 domain-containing membrane protein YozV